MGRRPKPFTEAVNRSQRGDELKIDSIAVICEWL
jgi:hypothetical protein